MRTELDSIKSIFEGYVVTGTVNGEPVSIDLPRTYVDRLPREAGREYMRRSLEKVYCAMNGVEYAGS